MSAGARAPEAVVSDWVDAFNARDLPGMLCCLGRAVDFHPLRLVGTDRAYRGHDGVRHWFARLGELRHEHVIDLSRVRPIDAGRVLATGTLRVEDAGMAPFSGLHGLEGGLIVTAHHYLEELDLLERLGVVT